MLTEDLPHPGSRKKRFVLLFENLQSVHLFKDVGQVPFQLYKHYGYDAEIVCHRSTEKFLYVDDVLHGLKITVVDEHPYRYLMHNARDIDVLMLMHISTRSAYRGVLYKMLNPKGCLYVKADLTGNQVTYGQWVDQDIFTHVKRVLLRNKLIKAVDVVSFETQDAFLGADIVPVEKRLLLPNGFDPDFIDAYAVQHKNFEEKENLILLVARHGDDVKNTELMLDALEIMGDTGDWNVWFVGPMTSEFERRRDAFLLSNPRLREKVAFTGQIDDKRELFELYNRAKILCLTSRRESWGMVCVEAMAFGCVPVMTAVSSAEDITQNGQTGFIVNSYEPKDWASNLKQICENPERLWTHSKSCQELILHQWSWDMLLRPLVKRFEGPNL